MKSALVWIVVIVSLVESSSAQSAFTERVKVEGDIRRGFSNLLTGFHQPAGVWNRTFGPRVTRPTVRGMEGERMQIFEDGIPVFSTAAHDRGIVSSANLLSSANVEVVRGPKALLYGIGSVGGVINILPTPGRPMPDTSTKTTTSLKGFVRHGGNVAREAPGDASFGIQHFHSGSWLFGENKNYADYSIPGQMPSCNGSVDEKRSKVPNSSYKSTAFAAGTERRLGDFQLIASGAYEHYSYSLPNCGGAEVKASRFTPRLALVWRRSFGSIRSGMTYGKWSDDTTLDSNLSSRTARAMVLAPTSRVEMELNSFKLGDVAIELTGGGSRTLQTNHLAPGAGPEPNVHETRQAFFGLARITKIPGLGPVEAAGRRETSAYRVDSQFPQDRSAKGNALSIGVPEFGPVNLSYTHSARIPTAYELFGFSNNFYEGVQERGNPQLGQEVSHAADAGIKLDRIVSTKAVKLRAHAYWYKFQQYVVQRDQDIFRSGLPVAIFERTKANFVGTELTTEVRTPAGKFNASFDLVDALEDPVRQTWKKPPSRLIAQYEFTRKLGPVAFETVVPRYEVWLSPEVHLLSVSGSVKLREAQYLDFDLTNAFNQTYVNPLSPLQAPVAEPGRALRLAYRFEFEH